ncbi:MAG TPA: hypothetical protein VIN04_02265 [Myxococcota bacterium]|jgi:hypothetical protein
MRKTSLVALVAGSLCIGGAALADEIEVPAWTPEPPAVSSGPLLPPVASRFTPTDVAAAPPPGIFAPAPPAFDRFSCDTFACGRASGASIGVIESPATPGQLPGFGN